MPRKPEDWTYFRAGGVVQVELKSSEDLRKLNELDQKLWMALAMPTRGISGDLRTLDAIDTDLDGRIRPPELLAAVDWLQTRLKPLDSVLEGSKELRADDLIPENLQAVFHRLLALLGKNHDEALTLADVDHALLLLAQDTFNGDGVIISACSQDPVVAALLTDILGVYEGVPDRSGQAGVDRSIMQLFLMDRQAQLVWHQAGLELQKQFSHDLSTLGAAADAWKQVATKVEDYFTRCRWVAFDERANRAANRLESDFDAIGKELLHSATGSLSELPLSHIEAERELPLKEGVNPAWHQALQDLLEKCLRPLFAWNQDHINEADWQKVSETMKIFVAWQAAQPKNPLQTWSMSKLEAVSPESLAAIESLIVRDEAQEKTYAELKEILYVLLYQKDLGKILRNFVNFSDFYRGQTAVFQVGSLFIDGRSMNLCIDVSDAAKHASIAGLAGAYLVYCECKRPGLPPRTIVALLTDGDSDNIMAGRNGVFYDLDGHDWDASVTRVVSNPISVKEAFWLPYKSLVRFIEEQISKRAGTAQQNSQQDLVKTAEVIAHAEKKEAVDSASTKSKFDPGTVAAIGVALGSIGTFFGVIFSKFIDLGVLMPFGILALVLLISGPSVILAWLKLRHRNLGPILDANGWAINTSARINVPFAASMTKIRTYPLRAGVSLPDPYAETKRPWKFYTVVALLVFGLSLWGLGKCDRILPHKIQQKTLFPSEAK